MGNVAKGVPKGGGVDEKTFYNNFYEEDNCQRLLSEIASRAKCKWCSRKTLPESLSVQEFFDTYSEYVNTVQDGTNDQGITASWFRCYEFMTASKQAISINSFGTDTNRLLTHTVSDSKQVLHVTVNHGLWDDRDKD